MINELKELDENLQGVRWPSAALPLHPEIEQARKNIQSLGTLMRSRVIQDFQNVAEELSRNTIPEIERLIRPSYSALATGSMVPSSAAMSSMAATSMGSGLESSLFQIMN